MKPFVSKPIEHTGGLRKIFVLGQSNNALIELNNHLANNDIGMDMSRGVEEIEKTYKIKLWAKYKNQIEDMYREYLKFNLSGLFPNDAAAFAPKLAKSLGIDEARSTELYREIGLSLLKAAYENAIADNILSEQDEERLEAYQKLLQITNAEKDNISEAVRSAKVQALVNSITSDGQLSPEEEHRLSEIAQNLRVNVVYDANTGKALDKMRLRWRINNAELPVIEADIKLPKQELCYLVQVVNWHEYRKERQSVNYSGISGRIKIAKGLYYRYGSLGVNAPSKDVLALIDTGKVYLTSKKLLFVGNFKNITIPLNKIIDVKGYNNGIDILKESGKSPFLEFNQDVDIFLAILTRAITEANG